jgi:predicted DNA-binding transcriptional regulator YafY
MTDITNARRLIKIKDILHTLTDEDHWLSLKQIIEQLQIYFGSDYHPSKNTVKNSINELKDCGFHIEELVEDGKTVYYSHQNRRFEVHELRMLIDAVSSARFISSSESNKLINKIRTLTSDHLSKKLQHQISVDTMLKAESNVVRYHIDRIHTSINDHKLLNFQYGNYNVKKDFLLRHSGKLYTVIPLALVWNHDYYYLVAKDYPEADIKHYRVDRMRSVSVTDERSPSCDFNISDHMKHTFNMYPGDIQYVEIQFDNHLINVVIDRFGKDVIIRKVDDDKFSINIKAAVSEGLIRWLLTWGSDAKVISPSILVDKMKEEARKMANLYS